MVQKGLIEYIPSDFAKIEDEMVTDLTDHIIDYPANSPKDKEMAEEIINSHLAQKMAEYEKLCDEKEKSLDKHLSKPKIDSTSSKS